MKRLLASACAAGALVGCTGQATHLVYVHSMTLGVDVTPITEPGGTAKLSIGYDRETYALVPRQGPGDEGDGAEAMSLTAISQVEVRGLSNIQFGHLVATGDAARAVATDAEAISEAARRVFGGEGLEGGAMTMARVLVTAAAAAIALGGCANSIYFYETEKVAVNIEGRPDPSAPLSGSVGLKQRIVSIVPSKKVDEDGYPTDDAVSLISYFNFDKDPDTVLIQTVLITGQPDYFGTGDGPPDHMTHQTRADAPALFKSVAGMFSYDRSRRADCIEAWLDETDDQDPNPRRERLEAFLEPYGISPTSWLNSAGVPDRRAQYQAFIDAERIDCD